MITRAGVHFAAVQGEGVLLDTLADTYVGLSAPSARLWEALRDGLDHAGLVARAREVCGLGQDEADALVRTQLDLWARAGLLQEGARAPAVPVPRARPGTAPATTALDEARLDRTPLSLAAVATLLVAAAWVSIGMARGGPYPLIGRLQAMPTTGVDLEELYRVQRAHRFLRRSVNQGKEDCVRRSLVLAWALRRRGVDARISIGIQKFPFLAHAWVEADEVVVNESLEAARRFVVVAVF